ncbi:MAG: penicillin acylase family protein [Aquihabitans sp.]
MKNRRSIRWGVVSLACVASLLVSCSDDGGSDGKAGPTSTSVPDDQVLGSGTQYRATIRRTDGDVPHITGDTLIDAAFGQGWASGEDRPCDLMDGIIRVNGERARWFGPGEDDANIDSDASWLAVGIRKIAEADWDAASGDVRNLMTAYTDGWNAQLDNAGTDDLADWCAGEDWVRPLEPVELYAYARSIALLASSGAVIGMVGQAQPPAVAPAVTDEPATEEPAVDTKPANLRGGGPVTVKPVGLTTEPASDPVADEEAAIDWDELAAMDPIFDSNDGPGSNGWAIGSERSTDGGGMLVANPHFPWEGELRFWEVQLTVPGEVDIYGVQLSGLPGVGLGFTENYGWTHTVSAGNRFTAYQLDLVDGEPTSYKYGSGVRKMTSEDVTIEVLGDDGEVTEETRTLWRSHYGPILDFPGLGWSAGTTISYRDANIDNDEFIEQYMETMRAEDLDEFIDMQKTYSGVPLFNTIATSSDGRAWYGDTAATPNLSKEAIAGYEEALESDAFVQIAADNGAVLLDGSDPMYEWEEVPGARDPGLVPFEAMPIQERADYVFNANDSFWLANDEELLEGDYSPLHGRQGTVRSARTRENATVLSDMSEEGPAGDDGTFTLDELADASLLNMGYMARVLRADVVERCAAAGPVSVEPLEVDGEEVLPGGDVDLTDACRVLDEWDGIYDLDRAGPALWREFLSRFDGVGELWADQFDAADPVGTPNGLTDATGQVLTNLARAVQVLDEGGLKPNVTLGEVQVSNRNATMVPIHGGMGIDGTTNVVGWASPRSTMDPATLSTTRTPVVPGSALAVVRDGGDESPAYRINNGTSFLLALDFAEDGPKAKAFLTYGNPADRDDPEYLGATERFSEKNWRDVAFTEKDVAKGATSTITVTG